MVVHPLDIASAEQTHFTHRLTGPWQIQPIPLDTPGLPDNFSDHWTTIPECAHLQPALYPEQPYWGDHIRAINQQAWLYRKSFSVPDHPFRRARLRFDGVDYFAAVWLNGQQIGDHEGHFDPFSFDVTDYLLTNSVNELLVKVTSPWDAPHPGGMYPINHVIRGLVKGLYEHGEGVIPPDVNPIGIWRPTWLLLDEGLSIDHIRIRTALDGRVDLRLTITNSTQQTWEGQLDLAVRAENHDGPGVETERSVWLYPGTHPIELSLRIPEPRLWWPWDQGEPHLYGLEAVLGGQDRQIFSHHHEVFGLRTVSLERKPERFTYSINDRPVYIRGSSYMPGLYLSQCDPQMLERDVRLAREANLNLLRVHVHVSPPELYAICDRMGMLIWQDFELNWVQDDSLAFQNRALILQRKMIDLLGNHPAIITWACHNEPTMVYTHRRNLEVRPDPALYADACQQDVTRPVFICSGQLADDWQRAGDIHTYYGAIWSERYTDVYEHHFRLNTEFGFEAPAALETLRQYPLVWQRLAHLENQIDALWEYQAELTQYHVEHLRRLRATGCGGYVHFWLVDLVPQVGCGVLDSERKPKGGYAALREASKPLHVALEYDRRRPIAIWVFNDTPQDYPAVQVQWQVRDTHGTVVVEGRQNCAVHANAVQQITAADWSIPPKKIEQLELRLIDPATGKTLAENHYLHPFRPSLRPKGYPWKFDSFLGSKVFDRPDAPSLADHQVNPLFQLAPVAFRQSLAEWALRQHFPEWFLSAMARLADALLYEPAK